MHRFSWAMQNFHGHLLHPEMFVMMLRYIHPVCLLSFWKARRSVAARAVNPFSAV